MSLVIALIGTALGVFFVADAIWKVAIQNRITQLEKQNERNRIDQ